MSDFEAFIPAYYVVSKALTETQLSFVEHALRITPVVAVIITDVYDNDLASKLHEVVSRVSTVAEAHALATRVFRETGQPTAIIGEADLIESYDEEGSKQGF